MLNQRAVAPTAELASQHKTYAARHRGRLVDAWAHASSDPLSSLHPPQVPRDRHPEGPVAADAEVAFFVGLSAQEDSRNWSLRGVLFWAVRIT